MNSNSDATTSIINTINTIFNKIFSSVDDKLYDVLDDLTFINSNILNDKHFEKILGTSTSNGILLIANALLIGFILYYAFKYLFSNFTYHRIENPVQFIFKIIIFAVLMNSSYFIIEQILDMNNNICSAIRNLGEDLFKQKICFSNLIKYINKNLEIGNKTFDVFSVDGMIKGTLTISLLNLVLSYAFRYIMIKVFIILSPIAFLSLCLENTSWFFKAWYKNLFSLLFIQIIVSIVILILFSTNVSKNDLLTKFIYIGGIYALIKANNFAREFMMGNGISINVQNGFNINKILVK